MTPVHTASARAALARLSLNHMITCSTCAGRARFARACDGRERARAGAFEVGPGRTPCPRRPARVYVLACLRNHLVHRLQRLRPRARAACAAHGRKLQGRALSQALRHVSGRRGEAAHIWPAASAHRCSQGPEIPPRSTPAARRGQPTAQRHEAARSAHAARRAACAGKVWNKMRCAVHARIG